MRNSDALQENLKIVERKAKDTHTFPETMVPLVPSQCSNRLYRQISNNTPYNQCKLKAALARSQFLKKV